jgi:hypothetical protein
MSLLQVSKRKKGDIPVDFPPVAFCRLEFGGGLMSRVAESGFLFAGSIEKTLLERNLEGFKTRRGDAVVLTRSC